MKRHILLAGICLPSIAGPLWTASAVAQAVQSPQEAAQSSGLAGSGEIIVTARKREETSLSVPVVLTAVSAEEIDRRGIIKLDDLAKVVPQLQLGIGGSNFFGGVMAIRGITGSEGNPFGDQSVSFNVDGVQVSKALIRRLAEMDLAQVEVLKGPQALFFGKNSPGGIISLRSADPTPNFEAKASVGYEFNAREWRGTGYIAGPVSETLGFRIAAQGTTMRGWFDNLVDDSNVFRSAAKHTPKPKEFAIRGTLKWEPTPEFSNRLKVGYSSLKDLGALAATERSVCPLGSPQIGGGPDDCKLNGRGANLNPGPVLGEISDWYAKDGKGFMRVKQAIISNEMSFDVSDEVNITSVTGYYYATQRGASLFNPAWLPALAISAGNAFKTKDFSQELRLSTSYDGPLNIMVGGYYQHTKSDSGSDVYLGLERSPTGVNPLNLNNYRLFQKGKAASVFGQVTYNPVPKIELSGGLRYSDERKRLTRIEAIAGAGPGPIPRVVLAPNPLFPRKDKWTDLSPEFSISYRPTTDLTVFGNYKQGFLSGAFNAGVNNFNSDLRIGQQKIKGFEGGIKARLLDGALRTNFAMYRYVVTGMQIQTTQTDDQGNLRQLVLNAGKVTVKGAEFDFTYQTPLDGLSLRGAVGYNKGVYNKFSGSCYRGQSQELGCNFGVPSTRDVNGQTYTTYSLQDQSGDRLYRAPRWSGNLGAGYEGGIGSGLRFGVNLDMTFSSNYDPDVTAPPNAVQKAYQLFDGSVRLGAEDDRWEVALIGKNLTDKHYLLRSLDAGLSGTIPGRAANDPAGNIRGDTYGGANRGREIMLRVTTRFGG